MNNIIKGTNYEIFINKYLNDIDKNNRSWMWKDIPEQELRNAGIIGDWNNYRLKRKEFHNSLDEDEKNYLIDTGCDILLKNQGKYFIVQCKNYAKENSVKIPELGGFQMMMNHYDLHGILYYTSKLSRNITFQKETLKVQYIKKEFIDEHIFKQQDEYTNLLSNPYDYQIEAYHKLIDAFSNKNRSILQLPCGLGKTLISMMVGLQYKQVVIISPLKQYCIQNLERFKSELKYKDYNGLIIDSDETRDIKYISEFIKNNKSIILSVCYKSCDVLYEVLNKLTNYIIIIDEFHNISKNEILGLNQNGMNSILLSDSKILFMSATPRIYELDDEDLSEEIFGEVEYSYNMGHAINTGKICDYEVFIPDIKLNNEVFVDDIKKEINIHNIPNDILVKSNYLLRGILETGSRKCIIYTRTHEEANYFKETIIKLNEYFAIELYVDTFLSSDNRNSRKEKLNSFTYFSGISILVSVELLNECIDIKECDSVFITYWLHSIMKYIQRISRSNRKDSNNINKISKIFLWLEEYNDMTDYISHLKDFDNSFAITKVKIMSINNSSNQILSRTESIQNYQELDSFIVGVKHALTWDEKFAKLVKYIEDNGKVPSTGHETNDNIENKNIASWFQTQKKNYNKKVKIMKHQKYYDIWTKLMSENSSQFLNHEEKWIQTLNLVKHFMNENKDSPSRYSKNKDEKELGYWLSRQKINCKNCDKLFTHENIVKIWTEFNNEFKKYLFTNEEKWYDKFDELQNYIKEKSELPVHKRNTLDSLGLWVQTQNKNHKLQKQIMSNPIFYELWQNFLLENKELFMSNEEIWLQDLEKLKSFIDERKMRPNKNSSNEEEKRLGNWLVHQNQNYKKSQNNMKVESIKNEFEKLIADFSKFI